MTRNKRTDLYYEMVIEQGEEYTNSVFGIGESTAISRYVNKKEEEKQKELEKERKKSKKMAKILREPSTSESMKKKIKENLHKAGGREMDIIDERDHYHMINTHKKGANTSIDDMKKPKKESKR